MIQLKRYEQDTKVWVNPNLIISLQQHEVKSFNNNPSKYYTDVYLMGNLSVRVGETAEQINELLKNK